MCQKVFTWKLLLLLWGQISLKKNLVRIVLFLTGLINWFYLLFLGKFWRNIPIAAVPKVEFSVDFHGFSPVMTPRPLHPETTTCLRINIYFGSKYVL